MNRRIKTSGILFCFLLLSGVVVLTIGAVRGDNSIVTYFELKRSQALLEKTVFDLKSENDELMLEIQKLTKSPNYARKVLRDRYHLTEDDESIIFLEGEG